jgi:ABC-type multidrug transport system permease subunit
LSGAFISVPEVAIWGDLTLSDILPTAVAAEALRQTMQFGQGYEVIWWAVIEISVVALVLIVLGGYLYTKRQLTRIDL